MGKPTVQEHHISYKPEITVRVFKGEHWIIEQCKRRTKNVSRGFLTALKIWIALAEKIAVDLEVEE